MKINKYMKSKMKQIINIFSRNTCKDSELKIYIVEDNHLYLKGLTSVLNNKISKITTCFNIRLFETGESAITAIRDCMPDVIIMDFNLGANALDGINLIKCIRALSDKTSLIILTNTSDIPTAKACYKEGATGYIFKGESNLIEIVEYVLDIIKLK